VLPTCLIGYALPKSAGLARLVAQALRFFVPVEIDQKFVGNVALRARSRIWFLPAAVVLGDQADRLPETVGLGRGAPRGAAGFRSIFLHRARYRAEVSPCFAQA